MLDAAEIADSDYDPTVKIQGFWNKYGVDHSRLNILNMYLFYKGESELQDRLSVEEMEEFTRDLRALLMAYFVAHHEKINLADITIPTAEVPEKSEEDKLYTDIFYSILGLRDFEHKHKP